MHVASSKTAPPRLKHDRRVYRLWFEYLKRAHQSDEVLVDKEFYSDWGDVLNTNFSDWWADHWTDLFAERESTPRILSDEPTDSLNTTTKLYLEVPINKPITAVLAEIKHVIKPRFDKKLVGRKGGFPSTAKFQITQGAEIRVPAFRMMLRCYHLKDQGVRTKDIPEDVRERIAKIQARQKKENRKLASQGTFAGNAQETLNRNVQRYIKQSKAIIRNVAAGEFPGKY